jgi:hypothetical protein
LLPLVRLKHEKDFTWGGEQKVAFERIKGYLTQPPMLCAPMVGKPFCLYIVAQERVVGVVLTQEEEGKEFTVAYLSRLLVVTETRYMFIEKLCLSLYYACSKCQHYLLSSYCVVTCQHDVVRYLMQQPILKGTVRKWVYSLVEYDHVFEPLRSVKGQVLADFIVDHGIRDNDENMVMICPWKVYFDRSVCAQGCGIRYVIISPRGVVQEMYERLKFKCTNNGVEYEALLVALEYVVSMGVKDVEVFGDSKLVVQQVSGERESMPGRCAESIAG